MVRVLAVADEVDEGLRVDVGPVRSAELILAAGDLPFEYLAYLMDALDVPLVFVPGNHDPDVGGYRTTRAGLTLRAGLPARQPWPAGAVNADRRIVEVAGLRIAGLGGSPRYSEGPNQYTERRQRWRATRLRGRADILLTHAPPRGYGDADDLPHRGFACLLPVVDRLQPQLMLFGHVHPYGAATPDLQRGGTTVRNVVGRHVMDVTPADRVYTGQRVPSHRVSTR